MTEEQLHESIPQTSLSLEDVRVVQALTQEDIENMEDEEDEDGILNLQEEEEEDNIDKEVGEDGTEVGVIPISELSGGIISLTEEGEEVISLTGQGGEIITLSRKDGRVISVTKPGEMEDGQDIQVPVEEVNTIITGIVPDDEVGHLESDNDTVLHTVDGDMNGFTTTTIVVEDGQVIDSQHIGQFCDLGAGSEGMIQVVASHSDIQSEDVEMNSIDMV